MKRKKGLVFITVILAALLAIAAGVWSVSTAFAAPEPMPPYQRIFTGELTDFSWNSGNIKDGQTSINSFNASFFSFPAKGRQFKGNKDYVSIQKFDEITQKSSIGKNDATAIFTATEYSNGNSRTYAIRVAFFDDKPFVVDGSVQPSVVIPAGWRVFNCTVVTEEGGSNNKKDIFSLTMRVILPPPSASNTAT